MGLIRGGLLVVASVLLFVGFLLANSLLVVSNSLEYDNIQKELIPVVGEVLEEQVGISEIVDGKLSEMEKYCENNSEFVLNEQGQTFDISCDSIGQGVSSIVNESINDFVEDVYYEDYDCDFIDCFAQQKDKPYFILSEKAQNYFEGKFYLVLLICVALAVVIFFFIETKTNLPILVGSLLIISSLPFIKLDSIAEFFAGKEFLQFFTFLFTQSYAVFIKSLIIGIVLIAVGIFLKFFGWGFKISEFFQKFSKSESEDKKVEKKVSDKKPAISKSAVKKEIKPVDKNIKTKKPIKNN